MVSVAMQWRQLISQDTLTLKGIGNRMRSLGLIPSKMLDASSLNILPMFYPRPSYDDGKWTIYPRKDVLCKHIFIEEHSLVEREAVTCAGWNDPGRPSYSDPYSPLPKTNMFDIYFREDYDGPRAPMTNIPAMHFANASDPSSLSVSLVASVNLVVRMRTAVLAMMSSHLTLNSAASRPVMPSVTQGVTRAQEQVRLGSYLMRLWDASPSSFRSLSQFRPDDLLPNMEQVTSSRSEGNSVAPQVNNAGGQHNPALNVVSDSLAVFPSPPGSERSAAYLETTLPSSVAADSSHMQSDDGRKAGALLSVKPSRNREYAMAAIRRSQEDALVNQGLYEPINSSPPPGETSSGKTSEPQDLEARCAQFTSNEWASVLKGVDLGGDLWLHLV
ncbi:hypothetical protein OE88DRAFT_155490 [Heliocybe sulcata]|uniref:Uncharacterized protein n=1 Tax=Heliocybe sulcata TaxID=5364 RepID=A0A5C3NL77_9AGAM|nr:hypothetical protein OE88DRAFT_155490 [Heliocybe sulcata]